MKNELLPPYDFTATERFKCGETNRDLYRTFMTGLDGTSMPSYIDKLSPDEAWDMVHFVRTLQVAHKGAENKVLDAAGGLKTTALKKP
jgi:cytochrome c oxidase cbb3-type subunit 2